MVRLTLSVIFLEDYNVLNLIDTTDYGAKVNITAGSMMGSLWFEFGGVVMTFH